MGKITVEEFQHVLDTLDSGVLSYGSHTEEDGLFCAIECLNKVRLPHMPCFDDPSGFADIRHLNDAFGKGHEADVARTNEILPLIAELSDWHEWSSHRQVVFATELVISLVRETIAHLPGLPDDIKIQCIDTDNVGKAAKAAKAVDGTAVSSAASREAVIAAVAAVKAVEAADAVAKAVVNAAARAARAAARAAGPEGSSSNVPVLHAIIQYWHAAIEKSLHTPVR